MVDNSLGDANFSVDNAPGWIVSRVEGMRKANESFQRVTKALESVFDILKVKHYLLHLWFNDVVASDRICGRLPNKFFEI